MNISIGDIALYVLLLALGVIMIVSSASSIKTMKYKNNYEIKSKYEKYDDNRRKSQFIRILILGCFIVVFSTIAFIIKLLAV